MTDALFALVDRGVSAAFVHGWPGAVYSPVEVSGRGPPTARPRPVFNGLLLFARAAVAGSELLRVRVEARRSYALRLRLASTGRSGSFS